MKRGKRMIKCARPECGSQFEAPTMNVRAFERLYMKHGWRRRGWITGAVYLCPEHIEGERGK